MLTLGIDPGLSGAVGLLDADGMPELVADLPVIRDRSLAWIDGAALQSMLLEAIRGRPCRGPAARSLCAHSSRGGRMSTLRLLFTQPEVTHHD
jgi:hypothetical protein